MSEFIIRIEGIGDSERVRQLEEIVQCRDCENYIPGDDRNGCELAYAGLFDTEPDGFCKWGRRDDADA